MKCNDAGRKLIQSFEACRLEAYQDVKGIWTIGYGNTMYATGISVKEGDTITQEEADMLFSTILSRFESGVNTLVRTDVTANQFSALVSFTYNCGVGTLGKSTLLKKVNANASDESIRDEFMKYNISGDKVWPGLTRRRKAEADLYFTT